MDEKIVEPKPLSNGIANGHITCGNVPVKHANGMEDIELGNANELTAGQKCFGEKSDVERVLDSRCPCLQSKCLHLSGSFLFFCLVGLLLIFVFRNHLKDFLEWLQDVNGWISGLIFILMFTIVSFPMTWGYIVLNVACGYLYGFKIGTLTVVVSVIVGVMFSLICCRKFMREFVQSKLQSEHMKAIIRVIESRRGFKVVVLTRLTPIPFGLQNGLFAITDMNIYKCLLASATGLLPTQALNAYMGSTLRTMEDVVNNKSAGGYFLFSVQVGIGAFLMWYVVRRARYELNKECASDSYDTIEQFHTPHHQRLLRTQSSQFSISNIPYEPLLTADIDDIIIKPAKPTEKKVTHKRAQSASAILYALESRNEGF